ncbi:MAG: hypothetical protein PHC89_02955 [Candidatus Pacebacteria bacterium]|nr:hypothetical protein [Candidatus Paceibacterota bacterium]
MDLIGKIFGSVHRVKIMRLFLFNETGIFDIDAITKRSRVSKDIARKEINLLLNIGFLKKKTFQKKVEKKTRSKTKEKVFTKVNTQGWVLDPRFALKKQLKALLIDTDLVAEKEIIKRFKKAGNIKLLILSGIFMKDENRLLDILVVGDKLKIEVLKKEIMILESEIGKELNYAFFETEEFNYRMSMYDKLIRDVTENDALVLVDVVL